MTVPFGESLRQHGFWHVPEPSIRAPAPSSNGTAGHGYLDAAVANEVAAVRAAELGTRNDRLNVAAFNLGQLVAGAGLAEAVVVDALTLAAMQSGLAIPETVATIASGLRAGAEQPRGVPEPAPMPSHDALAVAAVPPEIDAARVFGALPSVNWRELWDADDDAAEEWIVEPLIPAHGLIALYSPPKAGKSLLMLEIAVGVATGRDVLGAKLSRPRRVLYVDMENDPRRDIRERLTAMGVGPADLDNLVYLSFPVLAPLDTERGGAELLAAALAYQCELVILDTVSRTVAGDENENDTWLAFYRYTGMVLKRAGISMARLDHAGKDVTKGQRGGSAKSGDVDAVWRLVEVKPDLLYRLTCDGHRMPLNETELLLHRETTPVLRHRVEDGGKAAIEDAKVRAMLSLLNSVIGGARMSRREAAAALQAAGHGANTHILGLALSRRSQAFDPNSGPQSGSSSGWNHARGNIGSDLSQSHENREQ